MKKPTEHWLLLGKDAVRLLMDGRLDEVKEMSKLDWNVFHYHSENTDITKLFDALQGYNDWGFITEDEYLELKDERDD